ncbi:DUF4157 domain-containing protein, partial [Nocardioides hankookensis]
TGAVVGHEGGELDDGTSAQIESRRGRGRPLDAPVLQRMQSAFSANLSDVRIHDDPDAARLNRLVSARAFTTGKDVFFGAGEYAPSSPEGDRVLAHELAHTLQPSTGPVTRLHRLFTDEQKGDLLQGQYKKVAEEYEFKLGYALSKDPQALAGAKALTDKFKALLIERHGAGKEGAAYNPAKTAAGKVSKARAAEVFDSGNLRERMGAVYAAITNYEDDDFGLGNMLEATKDAPEKYGAIADTALIGTEMEAPDAMMFGRKGRTADRKENDRVGKTEVEQNKHLEGFFAGKDAPTPNKVVERGEAPLSSREYEGAFPEETAAVQKKNKGWAGLDEAGKVAAYNAVLGDKVIRTWQGGEAWNNLGPKLKEEGTNKNMRMLAGFSGTSDMYFHAGQYFKLGKKDLEKIRLAALGTMIPARDHSFHEIMSASRDYGLDYADGPVGYSKFEPYTSKQLLEITGATVFPHELIGATGKAMFDAKTADGVEQTPAVPTKAELPAVGWKAKYGLSTSTYESVLKAVDAYHAALKAKKDTVRTLADKIVEWVDAWMAKNAVRGDSGDEGKTEALEFLRGRALRAGTSWAAHATEQGLVAKATKAKLLHESDNDDDPSGDFYGSPELVNGLGEEAVIALAALFGQCKKLGAMPVVADATKLPDVAAAPAYKKLIGSANGLRLRAAIGENAGLMLRAFVAQFGGGKVCKVLGPKDPDTVAAQQLMTALNLVQSNFAGVQIRVDGGKSPREGDTHKVEGGSPAKRNEALAAAYKLTPLELDCINGYTIGEYKPFNDGTAAPERLAALDSGLKKLPRYAGPLYRGDYSYEHAEADGTADVEYAVGAKQTLDKYTSTAKSLADSFVPKRPTAHVIVSNKSGGDVEALSKKSWEQEVLFPRKVPFQVVAVVDKRNKGVGATDATLNKVTGALTGAHGLPTALEQQTGGVAPAHAADMTINDPHVAEDKWTEEYTKTFSNKVWIFWKEV